MEILLVFQIIVVVAMIAVILLQKGGSDGLTGGSSPNAFMTGRASANLFTRTTAILATLFLLNSLALAYIASHTEREGSVLDKVFSETNSSNKKDDKNKVDNTEDELEAPLADVEEKEAVEGKSASEKNDEVKSKEDKDNSSSIEKTLNKAKASADATAEKIKETSDKIESSKEDK